MQVRTMVDKKAPKSIRHKNPNFEGVSELAEALKANKSQEEVMSILLRYPRLMAVFIRMQAESNAKKN